MAIRLASHQTTSPANPIAPEAIYGLWLRDQGSIRTWLRIESPRIHLVLIDKDQGIGRILDGEYALARDGSLFGVMTTVENVSQKEAVDALYRGEQPRNSPFLPVAPPEKEQKITPFVLIPQRAGAELVLEGDAIFQGHYRKTAETRPTFARPVPPLGRWECENWECKVRTSLYLTDKIELEVLDQVTGRRLRLAGEYSVTVGNLLYGLFTSEDQSQGPGKGSQPIPPQVFCFRYAVAGANQLQIRDIHCACFDARACDLLQRDYQRAQGENQKSDKGQRRGFRRL